MSINLTEMAQTVQTEADFLRFAMALLADWQDEQEKLKTIAKAKYGGPGPNGWQNGTIGAFLDAMIAWAEDSDHTGRYDEAPNWSLFARMLLAGSRYE